MTVGVQSRVTHRLPWLSSAEAHVPLRMLADSGRAVMGLAVGQIRKSVPAEYNLPLGAMKPPCPPAPSDGSDRIRAPVWPLNFCQSPEVPPTQTLSSLSTEICRTPVTLVRT